MQNNTNKATPNPGSAEAVQQGCICAILDNEFGKGADLKGTVFFITSGCPLHDNDKFMKKITRKKPQNF